MSKRLEKDDAKGKRKDFAAWRQLMLSNIRLTAILSCFVILATSLALMVPVISMTQEAAEEVGIVQDTQSKDSSGKGATSSTKESNEEKTEKVKSTKTESAGSGDAADSKSGQEAEDTKGDGSEADADKSDTSSKSDDGSDSSASAASDGGSGAGESGSTDKGDDSDASESAASDGGSDSSASADASTTDDSGSSSAAAADPDAEDPSAADKGAVDPEAVDEQTPAQSFSADLKNADNKPVLTVAVEAPDGAFPADTSMKITRVADEEVLEKVTKAVKDAKGETFEVKQLSAVDIIFKDVDGNEIEPKDEVLVKITADDVRDFEDPILVHVLDKSKESSKGKTHEAEIVKDVEIVNQDEKDKSEGAEDTMKFESKAFSPYVVLQAGEIDPDAADDPDNPESDEDLEGGLVAADDSNDEKPEGDVVTTDDSDAVHILEARIKGYKVSVGYTSDSKVPEGSKLEVEEITEKSNEYQEYATAAEGALGMEEGTASNIRLLDIKIVDADGNKVEIAAPVNVKIELADGEGLGDAQVVHFADDAKGDASTDNPEVVENVDVETDAVSFEAEGFSAYAIVKGPAAVPAEWVKVSSLDELTEFGSHGFYIGHVNGYYFMNTIVDADSRLGIEKTTPSQSYPADTAAKYYFEKVPETTNQFYAYCYSVEGNKQYVYNNGDNNLSFAATEDAKTAFTISIDGSNVVKVNNGDWYWNMQGGNNGKNRRFCSYNNANDVNAKLYIWRKDSSSSSDPYGLSGKTYGFMNWNGGAIGKALMATSASAGTLDAKGLTVMSKKNVSSNKLFVPADSEITMWSFEWVADDYYYLTTTIDGAKRYLKINGEGLSLVADTPDDDCKIQVIPGSGDHSGQVCFKSNDDRFTLTYNRAEQGQSSTTSHFGVNGDAGTEWLNYVELSELTADYEMSYNADKVSVSDINNGDSIIVYTRFWNEEKNRYDFYAIDSTGVLVPCYESGDSIEWMGGQLNTMQWDFTEYYYEGTNTPNGYYELYNQYSEQYIAPQIANGQILSDDAIGINLNGRRDGKYYSTILAWDDDYYAYAGLKVEKGDDGVYRLVSCPKSEAMDFYFAVVQDLPIDDVLHTVPTVDNSQYGITMKMINYGLDSDGQSTVKQFKNQAPGSSGNVTTTAEQNAVLGRTSYTQESPDQGLLSTNLEQNGYPTTVSGRSLSELFADANLYNNEEEVNHLFIKSTYQASGYFEFDNTQNFASLNGQTGGDFTVYRQLGTHDASTKPTLQHGQFFPYNDLEPGVFASKNRENLYNALAQPLSEKDPRKHERLYLIKDVDYYYGMELEASFTQTPSGLDAWGHDIIYEFTGDDDFWLYVDGELVIDLGGIHGALAGSVNFRTGNVVVNGAQTNLRAVFESNYRTRNPNASPGDVAEFLAEYFEEGENVFKDNTTHTMKIFYMERGAGAANLHMRFNLASVKPGAVELTKEVKGVDASESVMAEYPFQVKYKRKDDDTEYYLKNTPGTPSHADDYVFYKDSDKPVPFHDKLEVEGIPYANVFMLKSGETVEIKFPTDQNGNEIVDTYSIVECGVNNKIYGKPSATANGADEPVEHSDTHGREQRKDYQIEFKTAAKRSNVVFTNNVKDNVLKNLTITKKLFEANGETEITDDLTPFSIRLYLATEFGDLHQSPANMHTYHVKDPDGYYCRWDAGQQKFVKIEGGSTNYDQLTPAQKASASFTTSMNGSVSKIPARYTVEVRGLLPDTQYRVEERPGEVPDGYSFQKYLENDDDIVPVPRESVPGVEGVVSEGHGHGSNPHVDVCNLKGFGLRLNKIWTDADFMTERDATYFAVFTDDGRGNLTPVPGQNVVRQLAYDANPQTLYWYFPTLPVQGVPFDRYEIREVTLSNPSPTVDDEGVVTGYGTLTPIGEGETVTLNGKQKGESSSGPFTYTVDYAKGTIESDSNVRVDTVTNDRSGIELKKADFHGAPLSGAKFEFKDEGGELVGTYTSDENGKITKVFLREGVNYTLTETAVPQDYLGLPDSMVIRLNESGVLEIGGDVGTEYYSTETSQDGKTTALIVKNRSLAFQAVKKDGDTQQALQNVHFELHCEKTVNNVTSIDVNPMEGYEDLITDEDGVIPKINTSLPAGTYELREKEVPDGYQALVEYIRFTVSPTGEIALINEPAGVTLDRVPGSDNSVSYTLNITNVKPRKVKFKKVDGANLSHCLGGAEFDLYKVNGNNRELLYQKLTSREADGLLAESSGTGAGNTEFSLLVGTYHLVETKAPGDYKLKEEPVVITVTYDSGAAGVRYSEGTNVSNSNQTGSYDPETLVHTLTITNHDGYSLPNTGGSGTLPFTLAGIALVLGGLLLLVRSRRNA